MTSEEQPELNRSGPIHRQMIQVSHERRRRIHETWVKRVLKMLTDEHLITSAALNLQSRDGLTFECNFVENVWDDPRIKARINLLAARDVDVKIVRVERLIAGKTLSRTQIEVTF